MRERNRIEKAFGPAGTTAGMIVCIIGFGMAFVSWIALILILAGAWVGFTSVSAIIEFDNKRVKLSNDLFGIISVGKWMQVTEDMKIGIPSSQASWRSYSRGNRTLDVKQGGYRVVLFNAAGKEVMPLKITGSLASAQAEAERYCSELGIGKI